MGGVQVGWGGVECSVNGGDGLGRDTVSMKTKLAQGLKMYV